MDANATARKPPPAAFFALGYQSLPERLEAAGRSYRFVKLFKHDFFAATGLYEEMGPAMAAVNAQKNMAPGSPTVEPTSGAPTAGARLAVLKVQRVQSLYGFPMRWLGGLVARHEIGIFEKLQGVRGVPEFLGAVGPTGFLHAFVPGSDLHPDQKPGQEFFEHLAWLLSEVHARNIAYVDTNKRENILFGEDGFPHLIDFQISFQCRSGKKSNPGTRWLLKRLQAEDWYHFYKHKSRLAPECCTPMEMARAIRTSWYIRVHRAIAQPIIRTRRRFLARYNNAHPGKPPAGA